MHKLESFLNVRQKATKRLSAAVEWAKAQAEVDKNMWQKHSNQLFVFYEIYQMELSKSGRTAVFVHQRDN